MAASVRIGTSGWHYSHWRGLFYPRDVPSSRFLACYAQRFDTVEINNTFYGLPREEMLAAWRDAVPEGFCFSAKASRYITHMKKLRDAALPVATLLERLSILGDRLGPVLFHLPPNWGYDGERLARFLASLPGGMRYVFELRDERWLNDEAYSLLARRGAAFCIYDLAGFTTPLTVTTDMVYIRLHGSIRSPGGGYDDEELITWAARIRHWAAEGYSVYCYLNNDAGGNAVKNAFTLKEMLQSDL